jgi:hypothetical protein
LSFLFFFSTFACYSTFAFASTFAFLPLLLPNQGQKGTCTPRTKVCPASGKAKAKGFAKAKGKEKAKAKDESGYHFKMVYS